MRGSDSTITLLRWAMSRLRRVRRLIDKSPRVGVSPSYSTHTTRARRARSSSPFLLLARQYPVVFVSPPVKTDTDTTTRTEPRHGRARLHRKTYEGRHRWYPLDGLALVVHLVASQAVGSCAAVRIALPAGVGRVDVVGAVQLRDVVELVADDGLLDAAHDGTFPLQRPLALGSAGDAGEPALGVELDVAGAVDEGVIPLGLEVEPR